MVIYLSDYPGKYRVLSFAKCTDTRDALCKQNLSCLFFDGNRAQILPDGGWFNLTIEEKEKLEDSCDFDVFEINDAGYAYKYYDNKSQDNAILVTNQCNSNCVMCPTAEGIRRKEDDISIDDLLTIVSHFPSDAVHITITGGEPFMKKEGVFRLLAFLKENIPYTEYLFLTNGRAFCVNDYVRKLKETMPPNIIFGIPIHGHESVLHDAIVQSEGAFVQTAKGIKHLIGIGAKVELRIVVSKLNAHDLSDLARLIVADFSGVYRIKFIGLEMTGNAARNLDAVWIDYPEAFQKMKDAVNILINSGIDVGLYNFPLCAVDKGYWSICEKSITDYKIRFAEACDNCIVKDACGGIFAGTIRLAKHRVTPILSEE